jgi:chemotaxis protein methyltransferase CheR
MEQMVTNHKMLRPGEYEAFREYLQGVCGIVLGSGKEYLVTSRLSGLMRSSGIKYVGDLLQEVGNGRNQRLQVSIIDAMTTNETFWFRDISHYQILIDTIFPGVETRPGRPMRIWSAACSSGQEPYNISMTVEKYLSRNPGRLSAGVEILGTDISNRILEEAKKGVYCGISANRGLDAEEQRRYFTPKDECIEVRPEIRKRVSFRNLNITQSYTMLGRFDVVFCRNVLIYFSAEKKADIIGRIARALNPGGYLFLGSTESMISHSDLFEMVRYGGGIVYRLR